MIPARFVLLDELPVNRSGKIDKRALPLPPAELDQNDTEFVAPATPAEKVLAEIWREVLGLARIGVHDDFFRIGGSSLSTVRVSLMSAGRGLTVSVGDLIEHPTIAQLAEHATRAAGAGLPAAVTSEVRLREGTGEPLWCVHPTGGSAAWFVPLARALPAGRPVHAFQARGLLGGVDPSTVTGSPPTTSPRSPTAPRTPPRTPPASGPRTPSSAGPWAPTSPWRWPPSSTAPGTRWPRSS
ncbi:hypothetical protein GCM10023100_07860 [Actinocorallia cavernae]|uniref:Carrier domain-containing protein n=1 Tax=Actinocorallia cavernae TaxID=328075 RepID=A0ABP8S9G8_9ACTN